MKEAVAVVAMLVAQRILGTPGLPGWLADLWLPVVWLVGPVMVRDRAWPWPAVLGLGLAWDMALEPVVGPGAIAWSAAAWAVSALARVIAHRGPATWFGFGAAGAVVVVWARQLSWWPLGLAEPLSWVFQVRVALLSGVWCGVVGLMLSLDIPGWWVRRRRRALR